MTFVSHSWCHVLGFREIIFKDLVLEFLSPIWFNRDVKVSSYDSILSFRLGGIARSCSLLELGQRLGIYPTEDTDHPFLEAYLDSCILSELREYSHLSVWALTMGEYVLRSAKESSFGTPLHQFMRRLIVSTIHHCEKHDKVLSDNLFLMWCLLYIDVHLHIPYIIASFLSSNLAKVT